MKTFQEFIAEARKFGGMGSISSPVYSIPDDPNFKKKYAEKQRLIAARKRTAEPTKGEKERAEKSAQAIRDNPRPVETPKTVLPGGVDHNLLNRFPTRETKPKSRYAEMPALAESGRVAIEKYQESCIMFQYTKLNASRLRSIHSATSPR